jgi:hypothetical protein
MTVTSTAAGWIRGVGRRSAPRKAWPRSRRKTVRSQLVSPTAGSCANVQQGRGLILLVCCCLWVMLALAGPAHSEAAARESTPNQVASEQGLTIADLEGAKIRIKLVNEQLIQREGRQFPVTNEFDYNITVEPGAKIGWSFQPTSHTPRGTRVGQKISTSSTLDHPWDTPNGEANWQFTEGALVFVRSFKNGGAFRLSIAFKQDGPNLTCSASNVFAHERGKNSLTMNSAIDGAPITIISWKTVSSSCDVTR